jgi:hypothetical protein
MKGKGNGGDVVGYKRGRGAHRVMVLWQTLKFHRSNAGHLFRALIESHKCAHRRKANGESGMLAEFIVGLGVCLGQDFIDAQTGLARIFGQKWTVCVYPCGFPAPAIEVPLNQKVLEVGQIPS